MKLADDYSAPYQVTCCVLASGRVNGWKRDKYSVCDRRYAEPDQFWETPFFTISSYQSAIRKDLSDTVYRYQIRTHDDNTITVETTQESRAAYLESVDKWCLKHLDRVFDLSSSGVRGPSDRSQKSGLLTETPVYCKTQSD